jgi:hypothetical protein
MVENLPNSFVDKNTKKKALIHKISIISICGEYWTTPPIYGGDILNRFFSKMTTFPQLCMVFHSFSRVIHSLVAFNYKTARYPGTHMWGDYSRNVYAFICFSYNLT